MNKLELIKPYIDDEVREAKKRMDMNRKLIHQLWWVIAIVCTTGDLCLPWHINYIRTIRWKIKDKFDTDLVYLVVWLEDTERTVRRKWKNTILTNNERKYQWGSMKFIDDVFIRNVWDWLHPSDLMLYLQPDIWVSHQEHFTEFSQYMRVQRKFRKYTWWTTKALIINFEDHTKYTPEWNVRKRWDISTSKLVERIVKNQKEKVINILNLNNNNNG